MACSPFRSLACLPLLLGALFVPATAAPITLQFDTLAGDTTIYQEQGYELRSDAVLEAALDGVPGPALTAAGAGESFELVGIDGRSFDLLVLRVAEAGAAIGPRTIEFEGEKPGGGRVSASFTTDGLEGWEAFAPGPRFADVLAVRWQVNEGVQLDAFELTSGLEFTRLAVGVRTYVEDGLLLRSSADLEPVPTIDGASPALAGPALGHTTSLQPVDGGSFDAKGFAALARFAPQSASVSFVGTKADGSTVSASFATTDTALVFERFDFPIDFDALVRLEWSDAPDLLLDTFEVEYVPGLSLTVTKRAAGTVTVFNLPDGNGRRLDQALAWSGVPGATPATVDASIDVFAYAPGGDPVDGVELALRTSLANVAWCEGGDLFDDVTGLDGFATFGGSLRAGSATDPVAGERTEVHAPESPGARVSYDVRMVASRNDGTLFVIDLSSGLATALCAGTLPGGSTEIEFDRRTQTLWVQPPGLGFVVAPYDLTTCSTSGDAIANGAAMNGLEFIGDELYGVGITGPCSASSLYRIDVDAGTTTLVGATGLDVPIAGLAYDSLNGLLYGATGCTSASGSDLVTVDLATGEALVVGSLGVSLGSIATGPDGALYGVGNNQDGGNFYRVDPVAVAVTPLGNTATGGLTGLALVTERGLDMQFNSADLDGDLSVDLADVGQFSADLSAFVGGAPAAFRSDFFLNGQLDLQDIGSLGAGVGTSCPPAQPIARSARPVSTGTAGTAGTAGSVGDAQLGVWFDLAADRREIQASAGSVVTATVALRGALARDGISAWAAQVRTSANLEVVEFSLADGAFDLGSDGAHVVGTGGVRAEGDAALVLATLRIRVRDEQPGFVRLEGVPRAAHGSMQPALVRAADSALLTFDVGDGVAAAINAMLPDTGAPPLAFGGFDLHNVPNPFNPATEIRFALPIPGLVELRIYDLAGRRVASLDAGLREAGTHGVVWNGQDIRGRGVTSGVYLCRLIVDGAAQGGVVKMSLVE